MHKGYSNLNEQNSRLLEIMKKSLVNIKIEKKHPYGSLEKPIAKGGGRQGGPT